MKNVLSILSLVGLIACGSSGTTSSYSILKAPTAGDLLSVDPQIAIAVKKVEANGDPVRMEQEGLRDAAGMCKRQFKRIPQLIQVEEMHEGKTVTVLATVRCLVDD